MKELFFAPLLESDEFVRLKKNVGKGPLSVSGLSESQKAHIVAALSSDLGRPVLVVTYNEVQASRLFDDLTQITDGVTLLPAREVSFYRVAAESREISYRRLEALSKAVGGCAAVVCSIEALLCHVASPEEFKSGIIEITVGERYDVGELTQRLSHAGYERVDMIEGRGQFAVRGGIIDVFPPDKQLAFRIEFFDDEADSIRTLDVMTQRSIDKLKTCVLIPSTEALPSAEACELAARRMVDELDKVLAGKGFVSNRRQQRLNEDYLQNGEDFFELDDDDYPELDEDEADDINEDESSDSEADFDVMPSLWEIDQYEFEEGLADAEKKHLKKGEFERAPAKGRATKRLRTPFQNSEHVAMQRLRGRIKEAVDMLKSGSRFDGIEAYFPYFSNDSSAIDYMKNPIILLDEPDRLRERCENQALTFDEAYKAAITRGDALPGQGGMHLPYGDVLSRIMKEDVITSSTLLRSYQDIHPKGLIKFEGKSAPQYHGQMIPFTADLKAWRKDGWRVLILCGGVARGERLALQLAEHDFAVSMEAEEVSAITHDANMIPYRSGPLERGEVRLLPNSLTRGFIYPELRFAVIADADVFGVGRQKARSRRRAGEKIAAFTDLSPGDYVVHDSHGVGVYKGTIRLAVEGKFRDYLHIAYQGADKLYVPTDQLDRVQKYIGGGTDGPSPRLNRLGGGEWQRQKAKVKAAIRDMADELVALYAARKAVKGHAFSPDTPWQREFEDKFPYEETPDQLVSIEEIKADMEAETVMDRLLCGDVGYGKTEVALRAALKAVMDDMQVAILAPTTILAQQHYVTIKNRFEGLPVTADVLSRFKTAAEQKKITEKLRAGKIDIIVGTHRLLAKDVTFKRLGLLIVDEEQRFGVGHKEMIKQIKRSVDVLTLSATPIPRTLHMSMVGIRDMSLLETPPEERYPVQTYVLEYSESLVRDAILREINRKGQVYFVYNRVQTIDKFYERLHQIVPEARIAVGHGQMKETALEDVMMDFYDGKYDVLLSTTIIESGLDIPMANTLIIYDADRFGLSQLYQLRGRVGRSNRLSYAYFTIRRDKVLTETAEKRLTAIREFTEFGSGFKIAMRDLEIRGAGNLLGSQQHGHLSAVGYDMYVKLIDETVREIRGELIDDGEIETRIEVRVDAFLPGDYVRSDAQRIEIYKKIAAIRSKAELDDMDEELTDRFGDPPPPTRNLLCVAYLKALCNILQIELILQKTGMLQMKFSQRANIDPLRLIDGLAKINNKLILAATQPPALIFKHKPTMEPEEVLAEVTGHIEKILSCFEETKRV